MANVTAYLVDKKTGDVVNTIVIDNEKTYKPETGLKLVIPKNDDESISLAEKFTDSMEIE